MSEKKEAVKSASLYELTTEQKELETIAIETADLETGEISPELMTALNAINGKVEEKATAICVVYRKIKTDCKNIDERIKELQAMKKQRENACERIEEYVLSCMDNAGLAKIDVDVTQAQISIRESKAVDVYDFDALPDNYKRIKTVVEPDKIEIGEALKRGEDVAGAKIKINRKATIK